MYAIIKTGGKQIKVEEGQAVYIEKLDVEAGEKVVFDQVVLVGGESTKVTFKYKPKKHSHRKQGHRQPYTKVVIDSIKA